MYKAHKMNLIKNLCLFSKQNLKPWNRLLKDLDVCTVTNNTHRINLIKTLLLALWILIFDLFHFLRPEIVQQGDRVLCCSIWVRGDRNSFVLFIVTVLVLTIIAVPLFCSVHHHSFFSDHHHSFSSDHHHSFCSVHHHSFFLIIITVLVLIIITVLVLIIFTVFVLIIITVHPRISLWQSPPVPCVPTKIPENVLLHPTNPLRDSPRSIHADSWNEIVQRYSTRWPPCPWCWSVACCSVRAPAGHPGVCRVHREDLHQGGGGPGEDIFGHKWECTFCSL